MGNKLCPLPKTVFHSKNSPNVLLTENIQNLKRNIHFIIVKSELTFEAEHFESFGHFLNTTLKSYSSQFKRYARYSILLPNPSSDVFSRLWSEINLNENQMRI